MNRAQKNAWITIICLALGSLTALILYIAAVPSALLLFLSGTTGTAACLLGHIFFKEDRGLIQFDERDKTIQLKATRISMTAAYTIFVLFCLGLWCYYRSVDIETVSIDILTMMIWPPVLCLSFIHALTTLFLYGSNQISTEGGAA